MSNEWFYIKQWKESRKNVWCIVDTLGNIYEKNLNKYQANKKICEHKNEKASLLILHKDSDDYNKIVGLNKEDNNENYRLRE